MKCGMTQMVCPNHSPLSNLRDPEWDGKTGSRERYSVNHEQIPNASEVELFEGAGGVFRASQQPFKGK